MKRAVLYIRVSTDEQADKGFSLASQEEHLLRYCSINNIEAVCIFREDHSAKTFNRPEFKKMINFCKRNKGNIDLLLFVKWDRFSRNTKESYQVIHEFQRINIEPQAIEQPLDLSVPESKLMLAIYLASPEVENDRRSLNVFQGMRRAKKEGRYMGTAPIGFRNSRDERNRPIIVHTDYAPLVKLAFEEMATGNFSQEEVRLRMRQRGLNCSRNGFHVMIRNSVYAGILFIPSYKGEEQHYVKGKFEPIINEHLFFKVQEVIKGRRPVNTMKTTFRDEFPLRGVLECPRCGKPLTGSSALSKSKRKYYYYHCTKGCKEIQSTEKIHKAVKNYLKSIVVKKEIIILYEKILKGYFGQNDKDRIEKVNTLQKKIDKNKVRLDTAMQMMLDGEIESADYRSIKTKLEENNSNFLREKASLELDNLDYSVLIKNSFNLLKNLDVFYDEANIEMKQRLLSLIFRERLIYKNDEVQTPKNNEILSLISLKNNGLDHKKRDSSKNFSTLSLQVHSQGFKPRTF